MKFFGHRKAQRAEEAVSQAIKDRAMSEDELFSFARSDPDLAEKTGFSHYSYWGSTLAVFLKNKGAVSLLLVLILLVAFTFIQPLLPGQYQATRIINHPITGLQLSNIPPSLSSVVTTAPEGTELIITPWENEEWAAVSNVLTTIRARSEFTVTAYLGDWVEATFNGQSGYARNDFTTNLKLPEDPEAVPYASRANFPVQLYLGPQDLTSRGDELFVKKDSLRVNPDGVSAVLNKEAQLRILPTEAPFLFGTNIAGQDLWSMVWSGTRTSLFIGFVVALVEALAGIFVGVVWGYIRRLDRIMTEIYNVINNIPTTIVLILVAYIMRPGISTLIFAMSITGWVGMARFIRNQIVIIRDRDYNLASRCLGTGTFRIITRNLLPYLVSVIMLRMALAIPGAIGSEVFITYIGLGLPVSIPSLGNLITAGRKLVSTSQSYQLIFPTIVLSIVTVSFYIIGNAFADSADPRNHV